MSQQPYPGQPGQPGQPDQPQPGAYPPPGQQGYPQGGYQQQQPPQGYGNYPGSPPPSRSSAGNPLENPALVAQLLMWAAVAVTVIGVIGSFFAFSGYGDGSGKFLYFSQALATSLGFGGALLGLSLLVKAKAK